MKPIQWGPCRRGSSQGESPHSTELYKLRELPMHQPSVFRYLAMLQRVDYIKDFLKVILGDLTSTGSGSSKKQAKHAAARAMLDKLDGRVPAQDGQTPPPPVADTANGPQAPGNTVGALQELCVKHGYPMPTYDLGTDTHFKMTLKMLSNFNFLF